MNWLVNNLSHPEAGINLIAARPDHSYPPLPRHSADNIEVINSNPSDAQRDAESAIAFRPRDFKVDRDGSLMCNPTFVGPATYWEEPLARFMDQRVSTWQYIKNKCKERVGRAWRKMSRRKVEDLHPSNVCIECWHCSSGKPNTKTSFVLLKLSSLSTTTTSNILDVHSSIQETNTTSSPDHLPRCMAQSPSRNPASQY